MVDKDPWESEAGPPAAAKDPWEATSFAPPRTEPEAAPDSHWMDFLKSLPTGVVHGLANTASASGKAAATEMGDPELESQIPGGAEGSKLLQENVTGPLHKPQGKAGKIGESVGEALGNPVSYVGPGGMVAKVAGAAVSGAAGEEASQLTGGSNVARTAASTLAGGLTGLAASERGIARLTGKLPTPAQVKNAGTAGYDVLKESNTKIDPEAMTGLHGNIKSDLNEEWFDPELAPSTHKIVDKLAIPENSSVRGLIKARKLLGGVSDANPTDKEAARKTIESIDFFLDNSAADDAGLLKHSNANWTAYKKYKQVEKALSVGENRAGVSGSGANVQNNMRQEIRKILDSDRKSRGFSTEERDKMEQIVHGTVAANATRWLGKFAPTGLVSSSASLFTALYNAPLAVGMAATGYAAKKLGDLLTARQIKQLSDSILARSAIGKPVAKEIEPGIQEQKMLPAAGAARGALESGAGP
jgi:hypothetical protein